MNTELLAQLNALIAGAEANQADADEWHTLLSLLASLGYGSRISPEQIAELIPNAYGIADLARSTQEVVPAAPAGSKMPRRKLTSEDERTIMARSAVGCAATEIAQDLGIVQKVVRDFLDRTHA